MRNDLQRLKPVDSVEIVTLVDNYVDVLLPDQPGVKRPPLAKQGEIPSNTLAAEHGLSLLVTVSKDGATHSILLDTGYNAGTVLRNMELLDIDPASIEAVVLSHGHMDHTGGLKQLLERLRKGVTVVAHPDVFRKRSLIRPQVGRMNFPVPIEKQELRNFGAEFVEAVAPVYLADNMILVSGEVPRSTAFEKGMPGAHMEEGGQLITDAIKDDQALVIRLAGQGLVVISGCAHSGIVNSVLYAKELAGESRVVALIGGFHLSGADMEPVIQDTVRELKRFSPSLIMPMHCTGWSAINRLQTEFPDAFVLSSVGTRLVLPREG